MVFIPSLYMVGHQLQSRTEEILGRSYTTIAQPHKRKLFMV